MSEESKMKKSIALSGRVFSEETKTKMSKNHADISGNKNPMFNIAHSEATKEKIRAASLGRVVDRIWINNGIKNRRVYAGELCKFIGYKEGRVKWGKNHKVGAHGA